MNFVFQKPAAFAQAKPQTRLEERETKDPVGSMR